MWFWLFMLICGLLIPLTMIIGGYLMWKHAPKTINGLIGYRTSRSMKNKGTWKFAHEYCGRLWWKIGWVFLLPSLAVYIPLYSAPDDVIGSVGSVLAIIQVIILVVTIYPTENALKRTFNNDGTKR